MQRRSLIRSLPPLALLAGSGVLKGCGGGSGVAPAPAPEPLPAPVPPAPATLRTFAYVASLDFGNISVFRVGQVGELESVEAVPAGESTKMLAFHPSGKFAYASAIDAEVISTFSVDTATGKLRPLGTALPVGSIHRVVVHPSGKFAYATRPAVDRISIFTIDDEGLLREAGELSTGRLPLDLAIHGSGGFLLIGTTDALSSYEIAADGGLGFVNTAPAPGVPLAVSILPSGNFACVSWADRRVSTHAVNSRGEVGPALSEVEAGNGEGSIAIHPGGRFVYAANVDDNSITRYSVDPTNGAMEQLLPILGNLPGPLSLAFTPSGRNLYATNRLDNTVSTYEFHDTGALTIAGAAIAVPRNPGEITVVDLLG